MRRSVRQRLRLVVGVDLFVLGTLRSGHQLNSILLTFQNQGSVCKSAFTTIAQSRFASVVVDGVLEPPSLALHP